MHVYIYIYIYDIYIYIYIIVSYIYIYNYIINIYIYIWAGLPSAGLEVLAAEEKVRLVGLVLHLSGRRART